MNIPKINNLSTASQLSLLAVVILLGAIFFTVNSALQEQNQAGHASTTTYSHIYIRSHTSQSNGGGSLLKLNTPTTVVAGDVLIAEVAVHLSNMSITPPSGWTLIRKDSTPAYLEVAIYKRVATGVDPSSFDWNFPSSQYASGGIVDLANVDPSSPIDANSSQMNYLTATMTAPSVTTTTPADELLFFGGVVDQATVTAPSGMTSVWTASTAKTTAYLASQNLTASGATGTRTGHSSLSGNSNIADLIALRPIATTVASTPIPTVKPTTIAPTAAPTAMPTAIPPTVTPSSGGISLVNPSFESGTTGWDFKVTSPAVGSFTTCTCTHEDGAASAQVTINTANSNNWYLQLSTHNSLSIQAGQTYTVSFYAKASAARQITAIIQSSASPYTVYGSISPTLTTSWQRYTFTFTPSSSNSNVFLGFNLASATGTVYIDNVEIDTGTSAPTQVPTLQPTPTCAPPPSCFQNGVNICTVPVDGWCTFGTPTPAPTDIPQPTATPVPGDTTLSLTVGLHGIGTGGDSSNPNSGGNTNPLRPTRTVTVDIYDAQNQLVVSQQGTVTYDTASGKFLGNLDLGQGFATGFYTIKVKTDQYLRALVPGVQTITQGQTNTIPLVTLVAGDINGDNAINIVDYNILIGCYSDLLPATNCNATNNVLADLTDDGHVNQFDYNLFLRELTNIGGQ